MESMKTLNQTSLVEEEIIKKSSNTADYKVVSKAMHEFVFPTRHLATESWLNHFYLVEEENLYFCKDNKWQ